MKKARKIITLLFLGILIINIGCRKYFQNLNTNKKALPAELLPPESLFSFAQKKLSDYFATPSVNINIFRFFAQYATNRQYLEEPRFKVINGNIADNIFTRFYSDILQNLKEAQRIITKKNPENKAQLGIIGILEVYAYAHLVELFGDIPYTEALDPNNVQPKYNDAKTVYLDLGKKLDEALNNLKGGGAPMGEADLVYKGDTSKWRMFANGLKLKMALMLACADNDTAKKWAQAAQSQVFKSAADNYVFYYLNTNPNTNPFYTGQILNNRKDLVAVNRIIDTMKHWADPRLPFYYDSVSGKGTNKKILIGATGKTTYPDSIDTSAWIGSAYAVGSPANSISQANNRPLVAGDNAPAVLMDYAEIQFYLCEACNRGLLTNSNMCTYFKKGVEESVKYWKGDTSGSCALITKHGLGGNGNCMNGGNGNCTVANASNKGGGNFDKRLAMHMWVALYNRGYDGWNVWRRWGHFPSFFTSTDKKSGIDSTMIPFRFTYPISEQNQNTANLNQAISNIGGNTLTTKLFFFKK